MAYTQAAADSDRLPWLNDDPKPARKDEWTSFLWTGAGAILLVAGASYWLGMSSAPREPDLVASQAAPPTNVAIPVAEKPAAPSVAAPVQKTVEPARVPAPVTIAPAPAVRPRINRIVANPAEPDDRRTVIEEEGAEAETAATAEATAVEEAPEVVAKPLSYWPASESEGAAGRVVRIGTFANRLQAKRAWWKVVKVFPGINKLNAVVAPVESQRNGRTYYRLQFGTTSQAHSEILCQRMRIVGQSCSVVGVAQ